MGQLPRSGKRELICLLLFTCNYVVSVWRGFLFLWVLGVGYFILLLHSLSLPYNYFAHSHLEKAGEFNGQFTDKFTKTEYSQFPLSDRSVPFMEEIVVTKECVAKPLQSLGPSKTFGHDELHPMLWNWTENNEMDRRFSVLQTTESFYNGVIWEYFFLK